MSEISKLVRGKVLEGMSYSKQGIIAYYSDGIYLLVNINKRDPIRLMKGKKVIGEVVGAWVENGTK